MSNKERLKVLFEEDFASIASLSPVFIFPLRNTRIEIFLISATKMKGIRVTPFSRLFESIAILFWKIDGRDHRREGNSPLS